LDGTDDGISCSSSAFESVLDLWNGAVRIEDDDNDWTEEIVFRPRSS